MNALSRVGLFGTKCRRASSAKLEFRKWLLLACAVLSTPSSYASSQEIAATTKPLWLVLPMLQAPLERAVSLSELTTAVETEMMSQGAAVMPTTSAAQMFETQHSFSSGALSSDRLQELDVQLRKGAYALATGKLQAAQEALRDVEALSPVERDFLARTPARAKRLEYVCITQAHLLQQAKRFEQALAQMERCRVAAPASPLRVGAYPSEVVELFERVRAERDGGTTTLVVTANEQHCQVRLNGIVIGVTPVSIDSVSRTDARIQVECAAGRGARVHPVRIEGSTRIDIDPELDAAIRTDSGLALVYSTAQENARATAHVAAVREALRGVEVIVMRVSARLDEVLDLTLERPSGEVLATLQYDKAAGYDGRRLRVPVDQALRGLNTARAPRDGDRVVAAELVEQSRGGASGSAPRSVSPQHGSFPWGPMILGASGAAMLATALATGLSGNARNIEVERFARMCAATSCELSELPNSTRDRLERTQDQVQALYTATNLLAVAGGVSVVGAVVWFVLLPDSEEPISFAPTLQASSPGGQLMLRF